MPRDGHIQMTVPLTVDLPIDFLKSLIDEAYDLIWKKISERGRFMIDRASSPIDDVGLMDELIDLNQLQENRNAIHQIARRAILLTTRAINETDIPFGATKLGGLPDLPTSVQWPVFQNGKPLAFLGQINLSDLSRLGTVVEGMPTQGTLSIFSVSGWLKEGDLDPQIPLTGWRDQIGWNVLVHTPHNQKLERRQTPVGVNSFRAAAGQPIPILSLPNHRAEPILVQRNWSKDEYDRFDGMQSDYRAIQMGFFLKKLETFTSHHLVGGYALFQQQYPGDSLPKNSTMLLQIGSDKNSGMCWGDGGELAFYTDAEAIREGRFERAWVEFQCG